VRRVDLENLNPKCDLSQRNIKTLLIFRQRWRYGDMKEKAENGLNNWTGGRSLACSGRSARPHGLFYKSRRETSWLGFAI
jgi:hypothetical protein